ncbi:MAG: rod shape-determining protein [Aerococcaceae bacterium]|nr:rod shape-determining protein [Aerococcaceae bacterium]
MSREIGIDLGTSNVVIHLKGHGIIVNEPAVLAVDTRTKEVIAFGRDAYQMIGRTSPAIQVIRPLKNGVIVDFELTEALLTLFLEKVNASSWFANPKVLVCCPVNVTDIERVSLLEVAQRATKGQVFLEEEAKVAAMGAGVDYFDTSGNMVIDIGGGTTNIGVIANGELVVSEALTVAGDQLDAAIVEYFREKHQLLIGERSAETAKKQLASALHLPLEECVIDVIKGRDLLTGLPKSMNTHSNHLHEAIAPHLERIARVAKRVLEDLPPELAADIAEKGIILTGGGAMIYQLDSYLTDYLKVSVIRAEQPMNCVAIGSGLLLDLIIAGKITRVHLTFKQKVKQFFRRLKQRFIG